MITGFTFFSTWKQNINSLKYGHKIFNNCRALELVEAVDGGDSLRR